MAEKQKMELTPVGDLNGLVYFIRGYYVMLDADIAMLYGYTVKRINEQAKRNIERFPEDFMFQLMDGQLTHHLKVMGLRLPCSSLANSYILSV